MTHPPYCGTVLAGFSLLWAVSGRGEVSAAPQDVPATPSAAAEAPRRIQGLWVWRFESMSTPEARAALLDFCAEHGFNLILMQVHLAPPAPGNPGSGPERELRDPEAFKALIADAAGRGIAVEALDGAKDMAMRENWPMTLGILDAVLRFNRTLPEDARLTGLHYDIEPYIMPAWKESDAQRQTIMRDLLDFYVEARKVLDADGTGLTLSADIPFWYDNKTEPGDSCMIAFNGETKNLHQHIQDLCDYVGIMSYRRQATGSNSVTQVVEAELAYGKKIGKVVTPALETIKLDEAPTISFHGLPPERFWQTHTQVIEKLDDHPAFGGTLVHSYDGLRKLIESPAPAPGNAPALGGAPSDGN